MAGQAPSKMVTLLKVFEANGVAEILTVVGTHALYAYGAAAGVRIESERAEGLLWDSRDRVRLQVDGLQLKDLLPMLQGVDPSFKQVPGQRETASDSKGFHVVLLREGVCDSVARFNHPVIDVNGRMSMMRTLSPRDFGSWAKKAGRDGGERQQAGFVESLLREGLLS